MSELADQAMETLNEDSKAVSDAQRAELCQQVPSWEIVEEGGMPTLQRTFQFEAYTQCLEFAQSVGETAEQFDHHPRLIVEWGKVQVAWWTHFLSGLHENDFIMAAKTDKLFGS